MPAGRRSRKVKWKKKIERKKEQKYERRRDQTQMLLIASLALAVGFVSCLEQAQKKERERV